MLQVKSSELLEYLIYLDKNLTVTLKRDSSVTIQSTNNGIDCSIISDDYTITHTISDLASDDGHITVDFNDLVSVISGDNSIDIQEIDTNIVMVNNFPVFKLEYKNPNHLNIKDNKAQLSKKDAGLLIKELSSYRSELKKSIFEESSWALASISDGFVNVRVVNPIEYKHSKVEIDGLQPNLDLFISKQRLKLIEIFFKSSEIVFSNNHIENNNYKLTFKPVILNKELYFPDKYVV